MFRAELRYFGLDIFAKHLNMNSEANPTWPLASRAYGLPVVYDRQSFEPLLWGAYQTVGFMYDCGLSINAPVETRIPGLSGFTNGQFFVAFDAALSRLQCDQPRQEIDTLAMLLVIDQMENFHSYIYEDDGEKDYYCNSQMLEYLCALGAMIQRIQPLLSKWDIKFEPPLDAVNQYRNAQFSQPAWSEAYDALRIEFALQLCQIEEDELALKAQQILRQQPLPTDEQVMAAVIRIVFAGDCSYACRDGIAPEPQIISPEPQVLTPLEENHSMDVLAKELREVATFLNNAEGKPSKNQQATQWPYASFSRGMLPYYGPDELVPLFSGMVGEPLVRSAQTGDFIAYSVPGRAGSSLENIPFGYHMPAIAYTQNLLLGIAPVNMRVSAFNVSVLEDLIGRAFQKLPFMPRAYHRALWRLYGAVLRTQGVTVSSQIPRLGGIEWHQAEKAIRDEMVPANLDRIPEVNWSSWTEKPMELPGLIRYCIRYAHQYTASDLFPKSLFVGKLVPRLPVNDEGEIIEGSAITGK
jgi:hypothetical protein